MQSTISATDLGTGHDVVAIGASEGGIVAVSKLLAGLPADLAAAVLVVIHIGADSPRTLPDVLERSASLPVTYGVHGEALHRAHVYVAPSDNHLKIRGEFLHVARGPKENGMRPSVDALFRSASVAFGPRVVGVVLTGNGDCGTYGLLSIAARGGVGVAQDPGDAQVSSMPANAVQHGRAQHVVKLDDLAALIPRLVAQPAVTTAAAIPHDVLQLEGEELGRGMQLVCPLCLGAMTESAVGGFPVARCHEGHVFSPHSLLAQQRESLERALWAASRALEESSKLAGSAAASATGDLRKRLEERRDTQHNEAELIRRMLTQPLRRSAEAT